MAPTSLDLFNRTMSNPNTNTLMSLLENAASIRKSSAAGFKTIYVGPDKLPLSVLKIPPFNESCLEKSASFDRLALSFFTNQMKPLAI